MESAVHVVQSNLNTDTAPEKFAHMCRSCLETHNTQPIFKLTYKGFSFQRIFESCTLVQIKEGDELPQNICFLCVNEVVRFHKFILKTQECDKLLKASLTSKQTEMELTQTAEEISVVKHEVVDDVEVETAKIDTKPTDIEEKVQIEQNGEVETESANKNVNSKTLIILKTSDTELQIVDLNKHPSQIELNKTETTIKRVHKSRPIKRTQTIQKKVQTFSCATCSDSFPFMSLLIKHCRTEGHLKPRLHECPTCHKRFYNRGALKHHMMTHMEERPFVCSVCGARFPLENFLQAHVKKIHSWENRYLCEVCGRGFSRNSRLQMHVMTHTGEKPHVCEFCGKGFRKSDNLQKHVKTHTGEKPHVCEICGKGFIMNSVLIDHRNSHTGETPYTCLQCNRQFASKRTLYLHKQDHSLMNQHGQTSFECKECGKTYDSKISLYAHTRIHKGIKPHKCEICGKTFANPQSLKLHSFTHTGERPYVCKVCDKAFRQQTHLKRHARMHSGEKPYSCTFCEKSFAMKINCTVHMRIHTGERPYVCDVCKKGFYHSSSMKKHRKGHYKN